MNKKQYKNKLPTADDIRRLSRPHIILLQNPSEIKTDALEALEEKGHKCIIINADDTELSPLFENIDIIRSEMSKRGSPTVSFCKISKRNLKESIFNVWKTREIGEFTESFGGNLYHFTPAIPKAHFIDLDDTVIRERTRETQQTRQATSASVVLYHLDMISKYCESIETPDLKLLFLESESASDGLKNNEEIQHFACEQLNRRSIKHLEKKHAPATRSIVTLCLSSIGAELMHVGGFECLFKLLKDILWWDNKKAKWQTYGNKDLLATANDFDGDNMAFFLQAHFRPITRLLNARLDQNPASSAELFGRARNLLESLDQLQIEHHHPVTAYRIRRETAAICGTIGQLAVFTARSSRLCRKTP